MTALLGLTLPMIVLLPPLVLLLERWEDARDKKRTAKQPKDRYFEMSLYGGGRGIVGDKADLHLTGTYRTRD